MTLFGFILTYAVAHLIGYGWGYYTGRLDERRFQRKPEFPE